MALKTSFDELTLNFERFVFNTTSNIDLANNSLDKTIEFTSAQSDTINKMESKIKQIEFQNQNIVLKNELNGIIEQIDSKADQIDIKNI